MSKNNKCILAVDDDPYVLDMIKSSLEVLNYEVVTATNGKEALDMIDTVKPDLVLLDVAMPVMDGYTACFRIRKLIQIPIIMLTAKTQIVDKVTGLEFGADDYITKPFSVKELLARIRTVMRRYDKLKSSPPLKSDKAGD